MNFLKKNVKLFIGLLIGGVLAGGIVYATTYNAGDISYTRTGINNVATALNDLYSKIPSGTQNITENGNYDISNKASVNVNVQGSIPSGYYNTQDANITTSDVLSGKKAYGVNGAITGTLTIPTQNFTFTSSTSTQSFNLGFRPKYISCIATVNDLYTTMVYNSDYSSDYVYKYPSTDYNSPNSSRRTLSTFFTINDNGFTWNITNWNGVTVYCTASR